MLKMTVWVGALALGMAQMASAQGTCPCGGGGDLVTKPGVLFSGKTVCAVASSGSDRWQEYHAPSGDLIDYKLGAGHPVDPTTRVGSWSSSATTLTHIYGPSASYVWSVCKDTTSGPYRFCNGSSAVVTNSTLIAGQQACP